MKAKRLKITINEPLSKVFDFTLDPNNTPHWVDSILKEVVSERPTRVGTIYKNVDKDGNWNVYKVTTFEKNKLFVFSSEDNNYNVRYSFRSIGEEVTELEYYEWVNNGELQEPFGQANMIKLKSVLEK